MRSSFSFVGQFFSGRLLITLTRAKKNGVSQVILSCLSTHHFPYSATWRLMVVTCGIFLVFHVSLSYLTMCRLVLEIRDVFFLVHMSLSCSATSVLRVLTHDIFLLAHVSLSCSAMCHLLVSPQVVFLFGSVPFPRFSTCHIPIEPHVLSTFLHVSFLFGHVSFKICTHVRFLLDHASISCSPACLFQTTTCLKPECSLCPYLTCRRLYRSISSQNNKL